MIFQHTWQQVLAATKTQTRRIIKPEHQWFPAGWEPLPGVYAPRGIYHRPVYQISNTYAVQPGRGKKQIARIQITGIRREALQDITEDDAIAEGLKPADVPTSRARFSGLWHRIHTAPGTRWEDNPDVWVLEFEVCRDLS